MAWSKLKKQMEEFLCPALMGKVEYQTSGYRYLHDKSGRCCITVEKAEVFQMVNDKFGIRWYQTEMDVKKDESIMVSVSEEEKAEILKTGVPEDRVMIVARNKKLNVLAANLLKAQAQLSRADFYKSISDFLSAPVERSLESEDILPNVFALLDRRVGKKRLRTMRESMEQKHPVVRYFYQLRCAAEGI